MSEQHESTSLDQLVREGEICMITTIGGDGMPSCRPLTAVEVTADMVRFLVDRTAEWTVDLVASPNVGLSVCGSGGRNEWVSLSGRSSMTTDPAVIERLWMPAATAYFTGQDDPRLAVLEVGVVAGEYWSAPGGGPVGRLVALIATAMGRGDSVTTRGDVSTSSSSSGS